MGNEVIVIAGPTASGKSGLAAALAQAVNGVVINADSLQLYAALPILTARPGAELTTLVPHELYGILDGEERSTAAWWAQQARAEIAKAHAAGRMPILVGGTGLYLEALMCGIAAMPDISASFRAQAEADLTAMGREAFYARLIAADQASKGLKPGDTQRILRAWQVLSATGRPLTAWQAEQPTQQGALTFHSFVILPERETLRAACDQRFIAMIEQGALLEVETYLADHNGNEPVTRALGFAALTAHLQGQMSLEQAIDKAQVSTRQYAKRQTTWFRNRFQKTVLGAETFASANRETLQSILTRLR